MKIRTFKEPMEYGTTLKKMEALANDIIAGKAEEEIWFLEHEDVYTAGTSSNEADLINKKFPVFDVGRGGKHTYHGPGQRVIYLMLKLKEHYKTPDLKKFVNDLEQWVIDSLNEVGVKAYRKKGMIGIWVKTGTKEPGNLRINENKNTNVIPSLSRDLTYKLDPSITLRSTQDDIVSEAKIAAIGIRVRKWVSFHGISININPELKNFDGIIPCGIPEFGVTSLEKLGKKTSLEDFDKILIQKIPFRSIN